MNWGRHYQMAHIIKVLAASSKKVFISLYIFVLAVMLVINLSAAFYLTLSISIIFYVMVKEDYQCETIDLRWLAALTILFMFCTSNILYFILRGLFAYLVFTMLRLITTKTVPKTAMTDIEIENAQTYLKEKRLKHGYLPILSVSIFVYLFINSFFEINIPFFLQNTLDGFNICKEFLLSNPIFLFLIFILLLTINFILKKRLYRANNKDKIIIPGYGDGDPFVLAAFAGVLGIMPIMSIFSISLIISLFMYLLYFLRGN